MGRQRATSVPNLGCSLRLGAILDDEGPDEVFVSWDDASQKRSALPAPSAKSRGLPLTSSLARRSLKPARAPKNAGLPDALVAARGRR